MVQWRPEHVSGAVTAVVADMRTRDYGTDARVRARNWAAHLRAAGCARLELRTDSTLRGAPADELSGALAGWAVPDPWVLAVPAFPEAGRTVTDGRLILADPAAPGHGTRVGRVLFPETADAEVAHLPAAHVDRGPEAVADAIVAAAASGLRRFVADATREEQLRTLARAAGSLIGRKVPLITVSPGAWLRYCEPAEPSPSYVLVVVSSATRPNQEQLAELRRRRRTVVVDARELVAGRRRVDWPAVRQGGTAVVVETVSAYPDDTAEAWLLAAAAARAAAFVLEDGHDRGGCRPAGIVVSGGQTASALMDALGVRWLDADGELAPLCPQARLSGGVWTGLRIVTKGGLVGTADTLSDLVDALWRDDR